MLWKAFAWYTRSLEEDIQAVRRCGNVCVRVCVCVCVTPLMRAVERREDRRTRTRVVGHLDGHMLCLCACVGARCNTDEPGQCDGGRCGNKHTRALWGGVASMSCGECEDTRKVTKAEKPKFVCRGGRVVVSGVFVQREHASPWPCRGGGSPRTCVWAQVRDIPGRVLGLEKAFLKVYL